MITNISFGSFDMTLSLLVDSFSSAPPFNTTFCSNHNNGNATFSFRALNASFSLQLHIILSPNNKQK